MKTADLSRYRTLAERLECIEEQLERKEVHDVVVGNSGAPAYSKVTKPVEGYIHGMGTVSLLAEKSKCIKEMEGIESFIAAIPVSHVRKALSLFCLDEKRYTWQEVADKFGYEGDIRRACSRYLDKITDW